MPLRQRQKIQALLRAKLERRDTQIGISTRTGAPACNCDRCHNQYRIRISAQTGELIRAQSVQTARSTARNMEILYKLCINRNFQSIDTEFYRCSFIILAPSIADSAFFAFLQEKSTNKYRFFSLASKYVYMLAAIHPYSNHHAA